MTANDKELGRFHREQRAAHAAEIAAWNVRLKREGLGVIGNDRNAQNMKRRANANRARARKAGGTRGT